MKISYICNYLYINDGWSPWDTRIGGSEEFVVGTSKILAKLGHKVSVFHNGRHGDYEGVEYRSHENFTGGDIVININYPEFKCDAPQILWTSLTDHPDLSEFKAVCTISEYAKQNTNIAHPNIFIVPPGYDDSKISPHKKIKKQCLYASSPDRGLNTLLDVWPEVSAWHPDATLVVTYGGKLDLPGVINLGEVDQETMNDLYNTSDYWLHPCNGGELYCMTGVKAQAAGCVPVVIPRMALSETVRHGFVAQSEKDYADVLIRALDDPGDVRKLLAKEHYPTWQDSTDMLLEVVNSVL